MTKRASIYLTALIGACALLFTGTGAAAAGTWTEQRAFGSGSGASLTSRPDPSPTSTSSPHSAKPNSPDTATVVSKKAAGQPSFAQTLCFDQVRDGAILPWHGAPVTAGQAVAVSATEANAGGVGEFIGTAPVRVENVAVVNSAMLTRVRTEWNAPLTVCLHYVG